MISVNPAEAIVGEPCTPVVLDAHVDLCIDQVGCDVYWFLRVDGHRLVLCAVVGRAGSDAQLVAFVERRHGE